MDAWCFQRTGRFYDEDGAWARSGLPQPDLLASLLSDPYFSLPPPKSTGRERFSLSWLKSHIAECGNRLMRTRDVQATLLRLTSQSLAEAVIRYAPGRRRGVPLRRRRAEPCAAGRHRAAPPHAARRDNVRTGYSAHGCRGTRFCLAHLRETRRNPGKLPGRDGCCRKPGAWVDLPGTPKIKKEPEASLCLRFSSPETRRPVYPAGVFSARYQTLNEEPQPQVVVAFGFLITNCLPSRSSLKSTEAPTRYW